MKKFLLILLAVIGFGICANAAQPNDGMCVITKGVNASATGKSVKFKNTNSYSVTVEYTIKFVSFYDNSKFFEKKGTMTLEKKGVSGADEEIKQSKYESIDQDLTTVKMKVFKCEEDKK